MDDLRHTVLFIGPASQAEDIAGLVSGVFRLVGDEDLDRSIHLARELRPECILLSYQSGADISRLKTITNLGIAVITIIFDATNEDELTPIENGAQDHLVRNKLNAKVLIKVIRTVVERHRLSTAAKDAIESLKESESRFRDISERIIQGLWVRSTDNSKCIYLNPAFTEIWGRNLAEMNAVPWHETVHPEDREYAHNQYLAHRENGTEYTLVYRIVRPDGEIRWVENHAYPVMDGNGKLVRMAGIALDITRQRKMEEELRIAQKLESLGQLSAGIAHEINTPSQYVSDNISFLIDGINDIKSILEKFPELVRNLESTHPECVLLGELKQQYQERDVPYLLEEMPQALAQAKSGIEQIKRIVLAMKGFTHPGEEMTLANLNEIVENTVLVAKNEWKYIAELEQHLSDSLPLITCIPSAVAQVVLNILVNASHALKDKYDNGSLGKIRISTSIEGDFAAIQIADNGYGVPEAIRERIFDPFFTTKEVGKGTGQGLALAHKVIREDHKGKLILESVEGEGASFSILLPLKQANTACREEAA